MELHVMAIVIERECKLEKFTYYFYYLYIVLLWLFFIISTLKTDLYISI